MKIRFTKDYRGKKAGVVSDLPDADAQKYIDAGAAEDVTAGEQPKTMLLRFRRDCTLKNEEGKSATFAAASLAAVEVNDEAWECVNRGDADLQPPPGEKGQPFPPDWVNRSEETDAPLPQAAQVPPAQQATAAPARPAPADRGEEPRPAGGHGTIEGQTNKLPAAGEAKKAADRAGDEAGKKAADKK